MPNHFHFLINAHIRTIAQKTVAGQEKNVLSEGIRMLLSSYTQAINKQNARTGSLFQQNTKAKLISKNNLYDLLCFHYIHQNPLKAKLIKKMEDWDYSSFKDYCGLRKGSLCNQELAFQLLDLDRKTFYEDSYKIIRSSNVNDIF